VNPEFCENVTVHGVTIMNPPSPNTDGINPESCKYVHISDCHITVGDDCITIKSGKDLPGRTKHMPAEDYTITNCTMLSGHGGVVIGSEMSGDVRRISISNCIFDGTLRGLRIKTARGRGGVVEDIRVSNIVMKNIGESAFVLDMQYTKTKSEPVSERTPIFRNIHFSNITAQTKNAGYINGLEELPIEGISFNDIQIEAENGFSIQNAKNISFHQVTIQTKNGSPMKGMNVSGLEIDGFKSNTPNAPAPVLLFEKLDHAFIHSSTAIGKTVFLQLKGNENKQITIKGNNFDKSVTPLLKEATSIEDLIVD
jgi:polygalacturonase